MTIHSKFQQDSTPKKFFTTGEKAVWKNLAAWLFPDDDGWVELPGPADWWPDSVDKTGFGFSISQTGHEEAMRMVIGQGEPENGLFDRIYPSDKELILMEDDHRTQLGINAFMCL